MNKFFAALCLVCLLLPRAALCEPEITPANVQAEELSSVRDKLAVSLFFRGELADKIIDAGMAGRFVSLAGLETNADVRGALLGWIQRNPAKAAELYLHLKIGAASLPDRIETRELSWQFNPGFMELIKDLNAAAGDKSVSKEELEMAARRLYGGGPQSGAGGAVVTAGGAGGTGAASRSDFFTGNYADYRLNKAGLEKELAGAGDWLESAHGYGAAAEPYYGTALSEYSAFVVAAAALKGRTAITAEESAALEVRRISLRARLSALALKARSADLDAISARLAPMAAEPGAAAMAAAAAGLKARFEASAGKAASGGLSLAELRELARGTEREFSAFYLRYSVYNALINLKAAASVSGYSCLYDYVVYRYLAAFFPGAAYPQARARLAGSLPALDEALLKAGGGDIAGAFSVPAIKPEKLKAAASLAAAASAFNRRAQFFLWGVLFRPVELAAAGHNGQASFRPAFTFFKLMERR